MEQNKDIKDTQDNNLSNSINLDELVESIPDRVPSNKVEEIPEDKPKSEGYKTNSFIYYFFCVFGVVFLSIFYLFQIYLTPITIVGHSMLPTLNASAVSDTDTEHCDMAYYRPKESYNYGDIVIISNTEGQYIDNSKLTTPVNFLIKRVVALPGDKITFYLTGESDNDLYYYYQIKVTNSNGEIIDLNESSYTNEPMYLVKGHHYSGLLNQIAQNLLLDNQEFSITISENCYFMLGDNRNHSLDCRDFGEVSSADICGDVRIHVKYGENIWIALFKKIKSYLSVNYLILKENLWKKIY